jgi:ABC-type polysaccharide/polyol phosphate export permease
LSHSCVRRNVALAVFRQPALGASNRLIVNTNLISKVYFPRLIIPAGAVITSPVDLLISAVLLAVLMIRFRFTPDCSLFLCLRY